MVDVGQLNSQLTLLTAGFEQAIGKVETSVNKLGTIMSKSVGKSLSKEINKSSKSMDVLGSRTYGALKDILRIAQGILVSQILYRAILQPIQNAVRELWNFNMELERTEVSLKYLLKETNDLMEDTSQIAQDMLQDLKILAARTPYTLTTSTEAFKTLRALGFGKEELIPLLTLMADLSAATGGEADQMQQLAWALGRVQQQGRLTRRELRLFVSARIPVLKMLEEALGVTEFPTGMSIPAAQAIPAILKGVMKYRGAAQEMEQTLSGLLSSLHDYFLFIARDILEPFFDLIKEHLSTLREKLAELWEVFQKYGLEGLISAIFPQETALLVWQLINVLGALGKTLANVWKITAPLRQEYIRLALILVNWLTKGFLILSKVMETVTKITTKTSSALRILTSVLIGLSVATIVTQALIMLVKAFRWLFLSGWSVIRVIGWLIGLLTALALMIPKVHKAFSNFGNYILKLFGITIPKSITNVQDLMGGVDTSTIDNIDWQKLIDAFSDVEEEADDANGALKKFLLAFDEIYSIPEETEKMELPSFDLGDIGALDFEVPTLEPLEEELEDLEINFEDLFDKLKEAIKILAKGIWDALKVIGPKLWETFKFILFDIIPKLTKTILTLIPPLIMTFTKLSVAILESISNLLPKVIETVSLFITALIESITTFGIDRIMAFLFTAKTTLTKAEAGLAKMLFAMGIEIGWALFKGMRSVLQEAAGYLAIDTMDAILTAYESLPLIGKFFKNLYAPVHKGLDVMRKSQDLMNKLARAGEDILDPALKEFTSGLMEEGEEEFSQAIDDYIDLLGDFAQDFAEETAPVWQQLGDDLVLTWGGTVGELKEIWKPALSDIGAAWVTWWDEDGKPIWEGTWADFLDIWEGTGTDLLDIGKITFEDLSGVFSTGMDDVAETAKEKAEEIPKKMYETYDEIGKSYSKMGLGLTDAVENEKEGTLAAVETVFGAITTEIGTQSSSIASSSEQAFAAIPAAIQDQENSSIDAVEDISDGIIQTFTEMNPIIKNLLRMWSAYILDERPHIVAATKSVAMSAIVAMQNIFDKFRPSITVDVNYNIPSLNVPNLNTTIYPKGHPLEFLNRGLQAGGVVMKDMLTHVGEGRRPEMVAPLSERALRPFASVIVSEMQNLLNTRDIAQAQGGTPVYVGTLIADKAGLRELERRRYKIAQIESMRRGD